MSSLFVLVQAWHNTYLSAAHNRAVPNWRAAKHAVHPDGKIVKAAEGVKLHPRTPVSPRPFPLQAARGARRVLDQEDGGFMLPVSGLSVLVPPAPKTPSKGNKKEGSVQQQSAFGYYPELSAYETDRNDSWWDEGKFLLACV